MMLNTVTGESGTSWVVDEREDAALARRGRPFIGWDANDETRRAWVQRVLGGSDELFADDREHLRRAYEVGQRPEIRSCPYIRQVFDVAEPFNLYLFQELADISLDEFVADEGALPLEERRTLRQNLTEALSTIHRAGLVHSDVQTSNVLRAGDVWKLADLGAAVAIGEPIRWLPVDQRFLPSHVEKGSVAAPSNDWWGLAEVLRDAGAGEAELA